MGHGAGLGVVSRVASRLQHPDATRFSLA